MHYAISERVLIWKIEIHWSRCCGAGGVRVCVEGRGVAGRGGGGVVFEEAYVALQTS